MQSISHFLAEAQEHRRAGRVGEAEAGYAKVLARDPDHAAALAQSAILAFEGGRLEVAEMRLRRAVELSPRSEPLRNNLGVILDHQGRFAEAAESYREAIRLKPDSKQTHTNLANALRAQGLWDEAIASYRLALAIDPDFVDALHNLGALLKEQGQREPAEELFRRVIRLQPGMIDAHVNLGSALQGMGRSDEALECFREAQRRAPNHPDAVAGEAGILEQRGDVAEACARLLPLVEAGSEDVDVLLIFSNVARALDRQEEAVRGLQRVLARTQMQVSKRQAALFALGRLHDGLGHFDEAWRSYDEGNKIRPRAFDLPKFREYAHGVREGFDGPGLARAPRSVNESALPIFVVGMPRSGTSLVEQILASHPRVFGAGELSEIDRLAAEMHAALGVGEEYPKCLPALTPAVTDAFACRYLRHLRTFSKTADRIVDKMPGNFMHTGLIHLLFPRAAVIHIARHPLDNCLSCYFQNFNSGHEFTYDLDTLGAVSREYATMMAHWRSLPIRMLEVGYEELVADQEVQTRRILDFCGLEWDPRCLQFHETRRVVRTASYDQVRQPMYSRSAGRWRRYEAHLEPLRAALGSAVGDYEEAMRSK